MKAIDFTNRRVLSRAVVLSVLAVGAAACGGGSTPSSAGSAGSAAGSAAPSAAAGSSGGASDVVASCNKMITAASAPLTFAAPGPAFDAAKLRGKKVMFLSLAQAVPAIAQAAAATQQAGKLVGINVDVFDTKGNVSLMQQGIQQAINTHESAIILLGIPLDVTANALQKAHAAGITLVSELNNQPTAGAPGQGAGPNVFGSTGPDRTVSGELLACKAVVDTQGKANVVIFGDDELTTAAPPEVAGMEAILKQCTGCTYKKNSTPTASWQTDLPSKAASTVQSDPRVNYLLPLYDGMAIFMVSGVKSGGAGSRVKIASFNAAPAGLSMIKSGGPLVADPGQPNTWMAWQGLDQAMRGMLGLAPGRPDVPIRFFDKSNLQALDVNNEAALFGNGYDAGFRQLWGTTK